MLAWGQDVHAQGRVIPGPSYFQAVEELYRGDYQRAQRGFVSEVRGAVRIGDVRWVDSICHYTMLGETLYQQGRNADALAQLDAATELILSNITWLNRIKFQQQPREDTNLARRLPVWARPGRAAVYINMPSSFLILYGRINNTQQSQQGGIVQQAQYWKLDAQEIARTTAWAIYRRGSLLGPLAKDDALHNRLTDRLAQGGLGPRGHWSSAWTELWWGLAAAAKEDKLAATPHLQRSLLLDGRYDHPLTSFGLLAQGEMELKSGAVAKATRTLAAAISSAVAYEQLGVLGEAQRLAHAASIADKVAGPPLEGIAAWAQRRGWRHVSIDAQLGMVERSVRYGDAQLASQLVNIFQRQREAQAGRLGAEAARLQALAAARRGEQQAAQLAEQAIARQSLTSVRKFQTQLASARLASGELSPRLARGAFDRLLGDPNQIDWALAPLDTLASLASAESDVFDQWFAITIDRREPLESLRVLDLSRRRWFLSAQPLAGRSLSIGRLLDADPATLNEPQLASQTTILDRLDGYRLFRDEARRLTQELRAAKVLEGVTPASKKTLKELDASVASQRTKLIEGGLTRLATPILFPPTIGADGGKSRLAEGEALLAFHNTQGELYGVLVVREGEHAWRVGKTSRVGAEVERLLAGVAGVSSQQKWTAEDLQDDSWREQARTLGDLLLGGSRLDLSRVERIVIVPDGPLWRAPFEALIASTPSGEEKMLSEFATLRIAPTPGWTVRGERSSSDNPIAALVSDSRSGGADEGGRMDPIVAAGVKPLPMPHGLSLEGLKASCDWLIVDAQQAINREDPQKLELLPGVRNGGGALRSWSSAPGAGPELVVLMGLAGGEAGGRPGRRNRAVGQRGDEAFHAVCGLLAGGVESALITRWSTGGPRSRDLSAEMLIGMKTDAPEAAWRRSVKLARSAPLNAVREPRLDHDDPAVRVTAEHPFWWAGWMLVD